MKTSNKERPLSWINNQYKKGKISFSHKLQRPVGQWNSKSKSLLIHSLLVGYPVNPIYAVEDGGIIYTLDGSQRTSTCIDYLNDKFALSKDIPNLKMDTTENGENITKEYELAGKKFSKLDDEVQSQLISSSLTFCTLSEYTDEEVREMFFRQNNGKPLNNKLMRVVNSSDEFSDIVYSLCSHPFMDKLVSSSLKKRGVDRDIIVQTFMLIATNQENDFTSFRSKDIDDFVKYHADNYIDKAETLKIAMDKLDEAFDEIKVKQLNIPMILYSSYRIEKDKKPFSKFVDLVKDFLDKYDENEEYKKFVMSGTSSQENVRGRFDYWRELVKTA